MKYAFFGTCFQDSKILIDCLISMAKQTITPNELILIDSSKNKSILKEINQIFDNKKTSIIYENINLPRVKALNYAISKANCDYLIRFDSRTRFSTTYAEEALKLLQQKNKFRMVLGAVGGRQTCYQANESNKAKLASDLMDRAYLFGNPLYRRRNYSGEVNSIYLGCFPKSILKETPYRDEISLISEDSQLSQDIISKGYKIHISQNLILKYICRDNVMSIIKLLRNYGRCRAKTIISTKTIHDKKKYFLIFCIAFFIPTLIIFTFKKHILISIFLIISIPLSYNVFHEFFNYGYKKIIYMPLFALIAQLNWGLGFIETFILYKLTKNKNSNFLK